MKTTDKFDYNSKFGIYKDCFFEINHYRNGNNYLAIYNNEGPITTCTVNANRVNSNDEVGIKDYSENEGMCDFLKNMKIIQDKPIDYENSGFIVIPYYKLTDEGKELFQ